MVTADKLKKLAENFKLLDEKDQERLVYISEGMRLAQNANSSPTDSRSA